VLASACRACAAAYRHDTDHTGQQFSVTRERIREIEAKASRKLKLKPA
jgi:DNA-directed RNA polymerase sigma subunit (sigma70/sigma32)